MAHYGAESVLPKWRGITKTEMSTPTSIPLYEMPCLFFFPMVSVGFQGEKKRANYASVLHKIMPLGVGRSRNNRHLILHGPSAYFRNVPLLERYRTLLALGRGAGPTPNEVTYYLVVNQSSPNRSVK